MSSESLIGHHLLPSTNTTPVSILASEDNLPVLHMKSSPLADSVDTSTYLKATNDDVDMLSLSMTEESTMIMPTGSASTIIKQQKKTKRLLILQKKCNEQSNYI